MLGAQHCTEIAGRFFLRAKNAERLAFSRACRAGNREVNVENREINVKNREINVKNLEINVKIRSRGTARPDLRARPLDRPGRPRPSRRGLSSRFWHLPRAGQAREMRDALCFGRAERNLPRFLTLISRFFHVNFAIFLASGLRLMMNRVSWWLRVGWPPEASRFLGRKTRVPGASRFPSSKKSTFLMSHKPLSPKP